MVLPLPVAPITGELLSSYLPRLAHANHLTLAEVLGVLPTWFTTKINNPDELAQHHMLAPATTDALSALARLARTTPQHLAGALPAFGAAHTRGPVRATTACRCCPPRRHRTRPRPPTCSPETLHAARHLAQRHRSTQPRRHRLPRNHHRSAPRQPTSAPIHAPASCSCARSRARGDPTLASHTGRHPTALKGIDCSSSKPSTTAAASAPTMTPTPAQRNTPTPSPSSRTTSTLAKTSNRYGEYPCTSDWPI
ncbi:TniQ family protein [Amycolatopsis sp. NPDC051371]|uniref:TniQ family protein n=1 Tax=Amycolatopsis sp. NPDC051371 TaxID=3155800 RepID=UPI00341FBE68